MVVNVLLENDHCPGSENLKTAHGLSLLISTDKTRILLDAGPGEEFAENAQALGLSLADVDVALLSHGHSDHSGGLDRFIQENTQAEIILHESAGGEYFVKLLGFLKKFIGVDPRLLQNHSDRIRFIAEDTVVAPGATVLVGYPQDFPRPSVNKVLFEADGTRLIRDRFRHEVSLLIEEPDGFVLFTGCSHSGIANMVARAREHIRRNANYSNTLKAVYGGFHLHNPIGGRTESPVYLDALADTMISHDTVYFTGHCTGPKAFKHLKGRMGERLMTMNTGQEIRI